MTDAMVDYPSPSRVVCTVAYITHGESYPRFNREPARAMQIDCPPVPSASALEYAHTMH